MKRLPILLLIVASAGACSSQAPTSQAPVLVAPALTVERFLQAANTRDLETMGRLFGTDDGPIEDRLDRTDVELQMNLIAEILQHDDYEIVSENRVPGVESPSQRVGVDINIAIPAGTTMIRDVGFTVVLESPNRWLINNIELMKITDPA